MKEALNRTYVRPRSLVIQLTGEALARAVGCMEYHGTEAKFKDSAWVPLTMRPRFHTWDYPIGVEVPLRLVGFVKYDRLYSHGHKAIWFVSGHMNVEGITSPRQRYPSASDRYGDGDHDLRCPLRPVLKSWPEQRIPERYRDNIQLNVIKKCPHITGRLGWTVDDGTSRAKCHHDRLHYDKTDNSLYTEEECSSPGTMGDVMPGGLPPLPAPIQL